MAATNRSKELRAEKDYAAYLKTNRDRPDHEVTVSILDSIHTLCYLLKDRDMLHPDVREAVRDLYDNSEGLAKIFGAVARDIRESGVPIVL